MAMHKYILNKMDKYHQEITVDDTCWTYLKADEVHDELDDLGEYEQIIVEQYLKYEQDELGRLNQRVRGGRLLGDSFEALEDYLDYDKLANALMRAGFIECDFGFLEIAQ